MKFAVLCYDFPHWKTQNGLLALFASGLSPSVVVGQPWKKLNIQASPTRIVHRDLHLIDPKLLCERFGFKYVCCEHDKYLFSGLDFGVILGARILKKDTIEQFKIGIVNFHPGILPDNRGLDNVKWAVKWGIMQGVTAHFINEKVDAGTIISRHEVPVYDDDTLLDIQFRVQNKEIAVLVPTVAGMVGGTFHSENVPVDEEGGTFKCMTAKDEETLAKDLVLYKKVYGTDQ